jgi:hypothetical protein
VGLEALQLLTFWTNYSAKMADFAHILRWDCFGSWDGEYVRRDCSTLSIHEDFTQPSYTCCVVTILHAVDPVACSVSGNSAVMSRAKVLSRAATFLGHVREINVVRGLLSRAPPRVAALGGYGLLPAPPRQQTHQTRQWTSRKYKMRRSGS